MNNSKKRGFNNFNSKRRQDEDQLFGDSGAKGGDQPEETMALEGFSRGDATNEADADAAIDDGIMHDEEEDKMSDEPDDAESLDANIEDDYRAVPELDRYEEIGMDNIDYDAMAVDERRAAEQELDRVDNVRDRNKARAPAAFVDDEELSGEEHYARRVHARMMRGPEDGEDPDGMGDMQNVNDYGEAKEPLAQWVQKKEVIIYIQKSFGAFLRSFSDRGVHVYENRITEMCRQNKQSFEVKFTDLAAKQPTLAIWLAEEPAHMLPILNTVASDIVQEIYPDYTEQFHQEIFVRISELPVEDKLRELRQVHLNALIKFKGVVTKRTQVFPQYAKMFFRCQCGDVKGPIYDADPYEARKSLAKCIVCHANGPYTVDDVKTVYRNYQKLTIQETPGTVPPGRVPRQKEVFLLHDLVDMARPGDEVEIHGIYINRYDYFANIKHGFPVFQTIVEVNNLKRHGDEDVVELTDEEKAKIRQASRASDIANRLIQSIAPSIYGHDFIKKGLGLAMFGGQPKDVDGKHRIRGDINMLLLGDPGTAKSQFLKYIEKVYHRVVYTTGKGASAVGLTAGVHKDPITGEWTLEGGALVLADKGICLIDEFDKMNEQDRTSIHEAMEQQTISISKAGIITTLQARCSVIAAANPIGGVYKPQFNFNDNVDLTDPILSRFDLLSVIRDEVNEDEDDKLATFVINSHMKSHPSCKLMDDQPERNEEIQRTFNENKLENQVLQMEKKTVPFSQQFFKNYIIYAKRYCKPRLNEIDRDKVTNFYADIRRESSVVGGIPIAVRHIESVLRMAESYARMHLRDFVRSDDIDFAIDMLLESFLQSQKMTVARQLSKKLAKYKYKKNDVNMLLLHRLNKEAQDKAVMEKQSRGIEETEKVSVEISLYQLRALARDYGVTEVDTFVKSSQFMKDYRLEGDKIKTIKEI